MISNTKLVKTCIMNVNQRQEMVIGDGEEAGRGNGAF